MKTIFQKTLYLLELLARENTGVQETLFEHIDTLLDVQIVPSHLAIALREVLNSETVKQNRESTKGIRGEKSSKDMASSRNLVSTIGALASPKMGDGTRCPEG